MRKQTEQLVSDLPGFTDMTAEPGKSQFMVFGEDGLQEDCRPMGELVALGGDLAMAHKRLVALELADAQQAALL